MKQEYQELYRDPKVDAAFDSARRLVLMRLASHSEDFRQRVRDLFGNHEFLLKQIRSVWEIDRLLPYHGLGKAKQLPRTMRPTGQWNQAAPLEYLRGLFAICKRFGLPGRKWEQAVHAFVREVYREELELPAWEFFPLPPMSGPLPWAEYPKKRGRPALTEFTPEELMALADCIAQKIVGRSWRDISEGLPENTPLKTKDGWPLLGSNLNVRTSRLAKSLEIVLPK